MKNLEKLSIYRYDFFRFYVEKKILKRKTCPKKTYFWLPCLQHEK